MDDGWKKDREVIASATEEPWGMGSTIVNYDDAVFITRACTRWLVALDRIVALEARLADKEEQEDEYAALRRRAVDAEFDLATMRLARGQLLKKLDDVRAETASTETVLRADIKQLNKELDDMLRTAGEMKAGYEDAIELSGKEVAALAAELSEAQAEVTRLRLLVASPLTMLSNALEWCVEGMYGPALVMIDAWVKKNDV